MSAFVRVMSVSEAPLGKGRAVEVDGRTIALFNTKDGWFALENTCPHAGGSLADGPVAAGCVACPLHFWEFDLKTGEFQDNPEITVQTYEVKVEGDDVLIRLNA